MGFTQEDAVSLVNDLVTGSSQFKIGKTGQELKDRFNAEYTEDFDRIEYIAHSETDKDLIDEWEMDLISHFMANDERCVNASFRGGEMTGNSGKYMLYVVIKCSSREKRLHHLSRVGLKEPDSLS